MRRLYVLTSGYSGIVFEKIYPSSEALLEELPILVSPSMFGNERFSIRIECV